jgi:hypothetical protein
MHASWNNSSLTRKTQQTVVSKRHDVRVASYSSAGTLFFMYFKKDPVECLSINDSVWLLLAHFIYYNYIQ